MAQDQAAQAQRVAPAEGAPQAPAGQNQKIMEELKVSAHIMTLETGVYCVFHAPGTQHVDPATGLPGVRVTLPPDSDAGAGGVTIRTFKDDGWMGGSDAAALVKIPKGPARILITVYQRVGAAEAAPKIQIQQLSDGSLTPRQGAGLEAAAAAAAAARPIQPGDPSTAEVAAHIQRRGDVVAPLGEWMGERGSQRWIGGFAIAPRGEGVTKADVEYQAVLGRGWLSPWAEGGQYCGSRGMALPILGLRVRLKGDAASTHNVRVTASFTDGSTAGPVDGSKTCEAESLAPLEAFLVEIVPVAASVSAPASRPDAAPARAPQKEAAPASKTAAPPPRPAAKPAPRPVVAKARPIPAAQKRK